MKIDYQAPCQLNPTKRFSNRVANYIKYRPSYPKKIIHTLKEDCGLTSASIVADVGSGTGILSELFLKNGNGVFAVEPNKEMREAAEKLLLKYDNFKSINGTAEETSLEQHSVDFVTAGQAFHWFHLEKARQEFLRILKPNGWVVLIWSDRKTDATPFLKAYEELLNTFSIDYKKVDHKNLDEEVFRWFFRPHGFKMKIFENMQVVDFEGFKGRLLSSSYVPMKGQPKYEAMMDELQTIFLNFQVDDKVKFKYDTKVYLGQIR
ncbi:MAG: class I SAM-dependent methyltransferase [bacterium]